jgi:glyoxylase-like metal-dependent hydrolase (beta-lactamase superfamily II)
MQSNLDENRLSPTLTDLGGGVYVIDALYVRPRLAAIYLVVDNGRAAFIETGTRKSMPQVLAALALLGIPVSAVDFVIPTHVHLDHAGGAGWMLATFPEARLVVHPRGVRHMIDPSRLWAGTVEVYGEAKAQELYGMIVPVDADRIIEASDGSRIDLAGRRFDFMDTPGHARHHVCIADPATNCIFTGDMFGMSYPELDVDNRPSVMITTTPSQFDPVEMRDSIARLVAMQPAAMYMTHFSRVGDVDRLAGELMHQLDEHVRIARQNQALSSHERLCAIESDLLDFYRAERSRLGWRLSPVEFDRIVGPDVRLNAQGLAHWLESSAVRL